MLDYNFFTPYILADRTARNRTLILALAFTILFVLIGGFYTVTELVSWSMKKEISSMQKFLNAKETVEKLKEVELKRKKSEVLKRYFGAVEGILNNLDVSDKIKSTLVERINSTLPRDIVLNNISFTQQNIQIQGEASSRITIAEFEHNLNSLEIFTQVHVGSIQKAGEEEKYSFDVQCTLKGVINK